MAGERAGAEDFVNPCPKCGGPMKEQAEFKGCWTCLNAPVCDGLVLTGTGARSLHEELCRMSGMTADQIVADWNATSPGDEW